MDAQTLAKTIKRRTKRGEWWTWTTLRIPQEGDRVSTLLSWGWLQRRSLRRDEMSAARGGQFAYRWTEPVVGLTGRVH